MWINLSSGCCSDVDLVESLHHKSYHNFYHNFYPKAIVNVQSHNPKAIICGKLFGFLEKWSDSWKTGQICGNWSDSWKTGRIPGNWSDLWKLVGFMENWSDS